MKSNFIHVLLLLTGLPAGLALASPAGELDPAFGDHGRILLRYPPFEESAGVEVFADPGSGKLLVVADGYPSDRLLRFNSDGSLDPDFGVRGSAELGLHGESKNLSDVEWLADGKLLIAGASNVYGTPDNVIHGTALLARMLADGTPDESFGSAGRAILQLGGVFESVSRILPQADGRIVVFGSTDRTGSTEGILVRYTQDGTRDARFGNGIIPGVSFIDVAGIDATLAAAVQQSDGKFLICGNARSGAGTPGSIELLAMRIHPDGKPDSTFGNNGMLLIGDWQDSVAVHTCLELADGHIIFAGSTGSDERRRAAAWRMTPDGRLDTGFGANGMLVLDTDTPSAATAMLIMSDSSVAIAGAQWQPSHTNSGGSIGSLWWTDMLVARFDPTSGEIDQGFGNRGMTSVDFGADYLLSNAVAANLAQQPDGKLVIVGSQMDDCDNWYCICSIAIARIDPYGAGSAGLASMIDSFAWAPAEGGDVELRLRRTGGSTGQLTVDYTTVAATATAGQDYVAASETVTWSDGDMDEKTISITVLDPGTPADYRSFQVALSNSSGGLAMNQATINIPRAKSTGGGGGGNPPDGGGASSGGGGVIGIELWLLMVLGAFGAARRSCPSGNRR